MSRAVEFDGNLGLGARVMWWRATEEFLLRGIMLDSEFEERCQKFVGEVRKVCALPLTHRVIWNRVYSNGGLYWRYFPEPEDRERFWGSERQGEVYDLLSQAGREEGGEG
jgi:hypothetical protein